LGGEPFDQIDGLEKLVINLKQQNYHLTIYTGYTLEELLKKNNYKIRNILTQTDLLIDGSFKRELAKNAGEYRGSSNQRLIFHPISREKK
jgi:anaerobic ribonucleoside-triphosphate reductase activating protein